MKKYLLNNNLLQILEGFRGDLKDEISLEDIRPALSAEIYTTNSTTTAFNNWKKGINHANKYDYVLHTLSTNILVIVLGKKSCVLWGDTKLYKIFLGILSLYILTQKRKEFI